jgi:hypothetical protein
VKSNTDQQTTLSYNSDVFGFNMIIYLGCEGILLAVGRKLVTDQGLFYAGSLLYSLKCSVLYSQILGIEFRAVWEKKEHFGSAKHAST